MDQIHNEKRQTQSGDAELWLISITAFFGVSLLIFGILSILGGPVFNESLGGSTTLVTLILGMFLFLLLTINYERRHR